MKSVLLKAIPAVALLLTCSYSYAAITHYENTDTNSVVYGSYEFDNELKAFFNISLKTNFSKLQGPTNINVDPISLQSLQAADGSRSDTYYLYTSGFYLSEYSPATLEVIKFGRWELVRDGEMFDYVDGTNGPQIGNLIFFTPSPGNPSSVPEPDILGMLLISPIILLAARRKRLK